MRIESLQVPISKKKFSVLADVLSLTKPRLSTLVLCTTAGGMWLAHGQLPLLQTVMALLATAGTVGAANALNCYIERDSDALMSRTAQRPLPSKRMEPEVALWFGVILAGVSIPTLAFGINLLTGLLALVAFLSYVFVYTPMKAKTSWAMWVGAVPGALPPLMGWTAVTQKVSPVGLVLFAILFFWQLPHFLAIALFRKEEYRRAGLQSVPLEKGDEVARTQAVVLTVILLGFSVMLWALGWAGPVYLVAALALGAFFLGMALWGWLYKLDGVWARKFFFSSLLYLTGLFAAILVDGGPRG